MSDVHRQGSRPDIDASVSRDATPPLGQAAALTSQTASARAVSAPENFEILEELGRGGMGVVYRAHQRGLNRVVALKMILAGAHAGQELLLRFRREAKAVAQLQHPNIVQIFEIGEHDGLPFFALEFVPGGTLKEYLGGTPLDQRGAARLAAQLSDAVHYAHERGIVHRDLKPANIMLASSVSGVASNESTRSPGSTKAGDETAHLEATLPPGDSNTVNATSWQPKITDFGLAKQSEFDAEYTRTGAVLGTPSYMAPEQAAGKTGEVGPLADVYALGAVLYEMLTGRPPFRAATLAETLEQVRSQDPVAPRRLLGRVSADLDTICLKCLQKDSAKRFANARELADDLRRFLQGVPIHARPVSALERTWRWCQRNRLTAASIAGVAGTLIAVACASVFVAARMSTLAKQLQQQAEKARASEREAQAARLNADENAIRAWAAGDGERWHRQRAERESRLSKSLADKNRRSAYESQMLSGSQFVRQPTGIGTLSEILDNWNPGPAEADLRGWEWYYLKGLSHPESATISTLHEWTTALRWGTGDTILSIGFGSNVLLESGLDGRGLSSLVPPSTAASA